MKLEIPKSDQLFVLEIQTSWHPRQSVVELSWISKPEHPNRKKIILENDFSPRFRYFKANEYNI